MRRLGVSAETVRRDLALLEEQGAIRRVHGGAAPVADRRVVEPSFGERRIIRHDAKAELARAAVGLLEIGQTVIIVVAILLLVTWTRRAAPLAQVGESS